MTIKLLAADLAQPQPVRPRLSEGHAESIREAFGDRTKSRGGTERRAIKDRGIVAWQREDRRLHPENYLTDLSVVRTTRRICSDLPNSRQETWLQVAGLGIHKSDTLVDGHAGGIHAGLVLHHRILDRVVSYCNYASRWRCVVSNFRIAKKKRRSCGKKSQGWKTLEVCEKYDLDPTLTKCCLTLTNAGPEEIRKNQKNTNLN